MNASSDCLSDRFSDFFPDPIISHLPKSINDLSEREVSLILFGSWIDFNSQQCEKCGIDINIIERWDWLSLSDARKNGENKINFDYVQKEWIELSSLPDVPVRVSNNYFDRHEASIYEAHTSELCYRYRRDNGTC